MKEVGWNRRSATAATVDLWRCTLELVIEVAFPLVDRMTGTCRVRGFPSGDCPAVQLERLQSGRQISEAAGRRRANADRGTSGSVVLKQSVAAQA